MSCKVCFEKYNVLNKRPYTICKNSHTYCKQCIDSILLKQNPTCPECREPFRENQISVNRGVEDLLRERQGDQLSLQRIQQIRVVERPNSGVIPARPNQVTTAENITVVQLSFQVVFILIFLWLNIGMTTAFYSSIKNYFVIPFLYIMFMQMYVLIKHKDNFFTNNFTTNEMIHLILKQSFFFPLQESDDEDLFYYIQFAIRWMIYVFSIVGIAQIENKWNFLAIISLVLNIFSIVEPFVSYYYMKSIFNNIINKINQNNGFQKFCNVLLMAFGFCETLLTLIFFGINLWGYLIFYLTLYICVIIVMLWFQQGISTRHLIIFGIATALNPFSLGIFYWLVFQKYEDKTPRYFIYILGFIKHILNPFLMMGLCVTRPYSIFNYVALVFNLFSPFQITGGLILQKALDI